MQMRAQSGMWRVVVDANRAIAEAVARRLSEAVVPEALAISLFESTGPDAWRVDVIYTDEPDARLALDLLDDHQSLFAAASPIQEEDWVAKSLEGLEPVRAGRFVVHGAHHENCARAGDIPLIVEAGTAFGTGHHGTTLGCLQAVDRLARSHTYRSVLDLGCGTGVLAMAAAKRFRSQVTAVDIDAEAVRVAKENAQLNACGSWIRFATAPGTRAPAIRASAPYDLVFANILLGPLLRLAPEILDVLAPGGHLILSGLLHSQEGRIRLAYGGRGLRLEHTLRIEGWTTFIMARAAA